MVAITIIVVAVPEGLPLAVTISLAYSMGKVTRFFSTLTNDFSSRTSLLSRFYLKFLGAKLRIANA